MLEQHPDTTAIVCNGDVAAMGAILGLTRMGLEAGKDVSIVGFDGTEEASLCTPPLTTLTVNAFGLGEQLAQTLLERIASPQSSIRSIKLFSKTGGKGINRSLAKLVYKAGYSAGGFS